MDPRAFYGRKTTKVSTLAEACEIIEQSSDLAAIVVLPPAAGDAGDQIVKLRKFPKTQKKSMNQQENLR